MEKIVLGKLEITLEEQENHSVYTFVGEVDENFSLNMIPSTKKTEIFLNLEKIVAFNSCGIREWVYWLQSLSFDCELHFILCSISMIDHINMIPQSLGEGRVESLFAPYFCVQCGEITKLINVEKNSKRLTEKKAPHFECEICNKALTFDGIASSYFLFLDHQKNHSKAS